MTTRRNRRGRTGSMSWRGLALTIGLAASAGAVAYPRCHFLPRSVKITAANRAGYSGILPTWRRVTAVGTLKNAGARTIVRGTDCAHRPQELWRVSTLPERLGRCAWEYRGRVRGERGSASMTLTSGFCPARLVRCPDSIALRNACPRAIQCARRGWSSRRGRSVVEESRL